MMQEQAVKKINWKIPLYLLTALTVVLLFFVFGSTRADAKTVTIKTPAQLKNLNWKNKGFGPGNTYVIGNDMTLGDADDATCLLTKGNFVIDFNGHTVQNASAYNTVFSIKGANVTMLDSKVKKNKPSVRSYGQGAVQITAGKLTIKNGNYLGASTGQNNPMALHVGGGTCVVNSGTFKGEYVGASCAGGTFYINGGTYQGGFPFALMRMGAGKIKISSGKFIAGTTNYGYSFPLGNYTYQQTYDFSSWFVKGDKVTSYQTAYWNMQSMADYQPFLGSVYAVTYTGSNTLSVSNKTIAPPKPAFTKVKRSGATLGVKWKKTARTTGYQVQLARNAKFTSGLKKATLKSASKTSAVFRGVKAKTIYYVRVRAYRSYHGKVFYSGWRTYKYTKK